MRRCRAGLGVSSLGSESPTRAQETAQASGISASAAGALGAQWVQIAWCPGRLTSGPRFMCAFTERSSGAQSFPSLRWGPSSLALLPKDVRLARETEGQVPLPGRSLKCLGGLERCCGSESWTRASCRGGCSGRCTGAPLERSEAGQSHGAGGSSGGREPTRRKPQARGQSPAR